MLENSFIKDFLNTLNQKQTDEIELITSSLMTEQDNAFHVGYLRALREIHDEFERLLKAYFSA